METVEFVVYNPVTGGIERSGSCPDAWVNDQAEAGLSAALGSADDQLDWFDVSIMDVRKKAGLSVGVSGLVLQADGVSSSVISPVPSGCFVTWPDGVREEVTDGVVEFSTDEVGTHLLVLDGVKYLPLEIAIEAHA
ncbi:MAG: hypothetical protein ACRBBW_03750 [Cellvibrionaceae bacterium]